VDSLSPRPPRLRPAPTSPVKGLAYYEQRIENPKATVICVHGGLDRGGSFVRLARRLSDFDVVAYDRRGYQGSRELSPLGLSHHVDDLVAIANYEARNAPVIAFGHSFGGLVTLGAAVRASTPIDLVVDYESPVPSLVPVLTAEPSNDPSFETDVESFFKRMVSPAAWDRLGEAERTSRRLDGPALVGDLSALHTDLPFDIHQLATPLVYIRGDQHGVAYYEELSARLSALSSNVTIITLIDSPHAAHLRNADRLAAIITEQWQRLAAG
jgi:pimeloyl-ACP methyl ester carboxylesterase